MMEKLLKIAAQAADQAEVFHMEDSSDSIEFNDANWKKQTPPYRLELPCG